ncbi:hypothetical protein BS17DRAFT_771777 [Gyrodon lividus]|nr:hypothetical protein BS17DRAFT_771777 [Gyrodon lividus]
MPVPVIIRPHVYRRGSPFSGQVNRHTTTIIIIVVSVIGGSIILFSVVRLLHRLCGRESVPLPPKQPIAYYREQYFTEFADRSGKSRSSFEPSNPPIPHGLSPAGSDTSLFRSKEGEGLSSSGGSAYFPDSGDYPQISQHGSPRPNSPHELQIPNLSFGEESRRNSSSMGPSCSTSPSAHSSSNTQSTFLLPIPRRHRPPSMVSTNSVRSTSNRSTIVGLPHGPHSQVKIVLPAPLAPALRLHVTGPNSDVGFPAIDGQSSSVRTSMVDMWAPTLHRSASFNYIGPTGSRSFRRSSNPSLSSPRISRFASPNNIDNVPPSLYPLSPFPPAISEDSYRVDGDQVQSHSSPSTCPLQTPASRTRQPASPLRQSHKLQRPPSRQ